jgi:hypothetical protein
VRPAPDLFRRDVLGTEVQMEMGRRLRLGGLGGLGSELVRSHLQWSWRRLGGIGEWWNGHMRRKARGRDRVYA